MAYTPQQWHDDDTSAPYGPINGTRLNYIEAGIEAAAAVADAAGGGGAAIGTATPIVDGSATAGTASTASAVDHVHPTDTSRSALASPTFTGTPAAPTAAVDTSTTQLATTAYVVGQGYAKLASPTFTGTVVLPTGTISTGMILNGTILDADISASAAVAVSKLAPGTAAQVLTTTGGTAVWADAGGGGAPSGSAGGDLSGTYPNPTVAKLNGVSAASYALLAGPTFTGSPVLPTGTTAVTQTAGDNSTKPATTAYIDRMPSAALSGIPKIIRRSSDATARNSSNTGTTLTADDTLLFAIAASEVWFFQAFLIFTGANTTMDAKFSFIAPSGGTIQWGVTGPNAFGGYSPSAVGSTPNGMIAQGAALSIGTSAATANGLAVAGVAVNSTTPGNITCQWAQNTSDAGNLVLNVNSFLMALRLA